MADFDLSDLAADESELTNDDDGGSGGEWVDRLFQHLESRGYLDALMAQQLDVDPGEVGAATDGGLDADALDADTIAHFGKVVIDQVGDVNISTVVQYAENNPETVNSLIQQALAGNDEPEG